MGDVIYKAILVSASYDRIEQVEPDGMIEREHWARTARRVAVMIFGEHRVTPVMPEDPYYSLNNARSFAVLPGSSKEGREEDEEDDAQRDTFIAWLEKQSYGVNEDGDYEGSPLSWVEVAYPEGANQPDDPAILRAEGP